MARACVGGEAPYGIATPPGFSGQTPAEVCGQAAYYLGAGAASATETACNMTGGSTGTRTDPIYRICGGEEPEPPENPASSPQTVTVVVKLLPETPEVSAQRVGDMAELFYAFVLVAVIVTGCRWIYNAFARPRYDT